MRSVHVYVTDFETIELRGPLADRFAELQKLASEDGRYKTVKVARIKLERFDDALRTLSALAYDEGMSISDLFVTQKRGE